MGQMRQNLPARYVDHFVIAVADLERAAACYEALGFTLTPRAQHPWGTANRLVQFGNFAFLEILEVDRPHLLFEADEQASPPVFSFGAFNRDFLGVPAKAEREGASMLVLSGSDGARDCAEFEGEGLKSYAPFDFERATSLPDGAEAKVAFSLAFTSHGAMPRASFFTCHHKFPQHFWKQAFQTHKNGAQSLSEIMLFVPDLDEAGLGEAEMNAGAGAELADFLRRFSRGAIERAADHLAVVLGPCPKQGEPVQKLSLYGPKGLAARFPGYSLAQLLPAHLAAQSEGAPPQAGLLGFAVKGPDKGADNAAGKKAPTLPGEASCGVLIDWEG